MPRFHSRANLLLRDDGRVVETGPPDQVLQHPAHPRTRAFPERVR
jgi:polar amino acid transport system ATP-binding protein